MGAQRGSDLLLKLFDGTAFITVAGLRAKRVSFNAVAVDATDSQSAGRWRELLAGAGLKRASVTGSGIFKDAQSDMMVRQAFFEGQTPQWQIVVPDFGTLEGPFLISQLDYSGEHEREVLFQMTLESAGQIGFAAA